jgi:hypothetical protein
VADRIIFQGDKTKPKDKKILWKLKERCNDPNMDSDDSVFAILFNQRKV